MPVHSTTIFTLAYLLPLSLAHLPQQKKHYLNMLSSKTNALLTHTLASFWRKQSCIYLRFPSPYVICADYYMYKAPLRLARFSRPVESPGGTGGMSYTAARGILLQLTRLSPAVPRAFCLIRVAPGCHMWGISVPSHTIPQRGAKKSVPERFPWSAWRNRRLARIRAALIATLGWKSTKPIKTRRPAVPPTCRGAENRANRNGA